MANTQCQRGGLVRLQNTTQQLLQIRLHIVLLFWFKTDLRSNLRALNCEKCSRKKCYQIPLVLCGYTRIHHLAPLT